MLGDVGSIASLVGVVVSLVGLGVAIWHLTKLRGETRAATRAAEETRRAVRRDLAIADISRMWGRIQALKVLHRSRDWDRALDVYPEIQRGLIDIQNRYPALSPGETETMRSGLSQLREMEHAVGNFRDAIAPETIGEFNQQLSGMQEALTNLENKLQQSN